MIPDSFWKRMKKIQRVHQRLYASGKGRIVGRFILLLTHTGRKSGRRYGTPLQYEKIDGAYWVGTGRGPKADWFRNILADPHVHVQVDRDEFDCVAEPVTDPGRVADFLEYRRKRHPLMIGLMICPQPPDASQPGPIPGVKQVHPASGASSATGDGIKNLLSSHPIIIRCFIIPVAQKPFFRPVPCMIELAHEFFIDLSPAFRIPRIKWHSQPRRLKPNWRKPNAPDWPATRVGRASVRAGQPAWQPGIF